MNGFLSCSFLCVLSVSAFPTIESPGRMSGTLYSEARERSRRHRCGAAPHDCTHSFSRNNDICQIVAQEGFTNGNPFAAAPQEVIHILPDSYNRLQWIDTVRVARPANSDSPKPFAQSSARRNTGRPHKTPPSRRLRARTCRDAGNLLFDHALAESLKIGNGRPRTTLGRGAVSPRWLF